MKKKKYAFGSLSANNSQVENYLESPQEALADQQMAIAQAMYEASTDPLYMGLKGAGNLLMSKGSLGNPIADGAMKLFGNMEFAMGGTVEIEGEEAVELPNGSTSKVKGPSHEKGGIDINLPNGTKVFSKRIEVDGVTMADRKMNREKQIKQLQKKLEENPTDKITQNSFTRQKEVLDKEEMNDLKLQEIIGSILGAKDKAAFGDTIGEGDLDLQVDETLKAYGPGEETADAFSEDGGGFLNNIKIFDGENDGGVGFGDLLGIGGDLFSTFAPYLNTLKNRAGDTPNVNKFKNFGKDALQDIDEAQTYVAQQRDNALSDIELSSEGARTRARNTSRSVNTMRATDLAIEQQANRAKTDVYDNFAQQMMQLLGQEANLENVQDQVVMGGEQARDLADRQDRDAFSTALAKNISTIGQGLQETGKDINAMKQDDVVMNLLQQLSKYGLKVDKDGNVTQ